jgi:hypothetical protein
MAEHLKNLCLNLVNKRNAPIESKNICGENFGLDSRHSNENFA